MRRNSKRRFIYLGIGFGVLLLCIAVFLILYMKKQKAEVAAVVYTESKRESGDVTWQGQEYRYNDHLSNYLFIGVDEYDLEDGEMGDRQAGKCDALFLVSYDRVKKNMAVISIPRDTMTEIEVFLPDGSSGGRSKDHISLSYGFGDGKHESCRLTEEAVSNLFYGLDINGYCAMSMSGLPVIPDTIGSFDVVIPNDSMIAVNPEYTKGSTVTVTSENAESFVRYRDVETTQSALLRQERQMAFLEAAMVKVEGQFEQNSAIATDLYNALTPYLVTNMGNDLFLELMESAYSGSEIVSWTVPGEGAEGNEYDEYHVNDDQLYEKIIETFYVRVES